MGIWATLNMLFMLLNITLKAFIWIYLNNLYEHINEVIKKNFLNGKYGYSTLYYHYEQSLS